MCPIHNSTQMPPLRSTIPERFWSKTNKTDGCWNWTASVDRKHGYGWFSVNRRMMKAQRVVWILTHGNIPSELHVLHRCDNRRCANPAHLFLGTNGDNIADRMSKGRKSGARGERNGKAKLQGVEVMEIRSRLESSEQQSVIATAYGVSQQCISSIAVGVNWNAL